MNSKLLEILEPIGFLLIRRSSRKTPEKPLAKVSKFINKDVKRDDRKRLASKTPPKLNAERMTNKDLNVGMLNIHNNKENVGSNQRKPSVSPDLKKEVKKPRPFESNVKENNNSNVNKKEKVEKNEKVEKVNNERDKGKKSATTTNSNNLVSSINNLKKVVKLKEKEFLKTEENTPLSKRINSKMLEKKKIETKGSLMNKTAKKDSNSKLKTDDTTYNFEDFGNINIESREFFEIIYIVSEIYSNSSTEIAKTLKGILDLNRSDSDVIDSFIIERAKKNKFPVKSE
jgi:hypothetical protein